MRSADDLPVTWQPLVDQTLRQRDTALRARGRAGIGFWQMFRPACLVNDSYCVVIEHVSGNRSQFGRTLVGTGSMLDGGLQALAAVALLPDADLSSIASFASAQEALRKANLAVPEKPAMVTVGPPRTGVFVLPDCNGNGGLEDLLIDCAAAVYPDLLAVARTFIGSVAIDSTAYTAEDTVEMRTPQGPLKAIVGSMASVLQPGSTIQVSVQRNRWVSPPSMRTARLGALTNFLKTLCDIS